MLRIVKRPLARQDLIDIWRYTEKTWGERQADTYLDELDAGIRQLLEYPELGRDRSDVRPGYRSLAVNRHIVFYTLDEDVIRVVRVLHSRMDPDKRL